MIKLLKQDNEFYLNDEDGLYFNADHDYIALITNKSKDDIPRYDFETENGNIHRQCRIVIYNPERTIYLGKL